MVWIVTGPGRCGTNWLAEVLGVPIEPFGHFKTTDPYAWMTDHEVCVNHYACDYIQELAPLVDTWVFVHRDPVDYLCSMLGRWYGKQFPHWCTVDEQARTGARQLLGGLEASLALMEHYGVTPSHWHMNLYTTEPGLQKLAAHLRVSLAYPLKLPEPLNVGTKKVVREQLHPATLDYIQAVHSGLPRLTQGYLASLRA